MLATIWSNWYSPTMINETIAAIAAMIRLLSAEGGRWLGVGGGDVIVSGGPDSRTSRLGLLRRLLEVVLWNRCHRVFQDFRIPAFPLREPGDDEQDRPDEEDRKPDELCRDRRLVQRDDEPLRQARDHRARDTQEPSEEPEWNQVHPVVTVHARAPRFFSYRAYHHMIPMKANPITIWPNRLATAQGHGAISCRFPNGATLTPWSGSKTGPLASVKSPYKTGPPTGIGRVVGAAGMFPTFCTATPTCR